MLSHIRKEIDDDNFTDPGFFAKGDANRHMTFSYGAHHCIGRELARLEIETMLEEVLKRDLTDRYRR